MDGKLSFPGFITGLLSQNQTGTDALFRWCTQSFRASHRGMWRVYAWLSVNLVNHHQKVFADKTTHRHENQTVNRVCRETGSLCLFTQQSLTGGWPKLVQTQTWFHDVAREVSAATGKTCVYFSYRLNQIFFHSWDKMSCFSVLGVTLCELSFGSVT